MCSMKPYILFIGLFLLHSTTSECINSYFAGDTLTVWAEGGLFLRDTNSINGHKLGLIPYGHTLKILETKTFRYKEDSILYFNARQDEYGRLYEEYYLKGHWVKVIYNSKTGYVFDGYLSHFSAPKILVYNEQEDLIHYIERVFGLISSHKKESDTKDITIVSKYFHKGISVCYTIFEPKGGKARYVLPEFSLEEIMIFYKNGKGINYENGGYMLRADQGSGQIRTLKLGYCIEIYADEL